LVLGYEKYFVIDKRMLDSMAKISEINRKNAEVDIKLQEGDPNIFY